MTIDQFSLQALNVRIAGEERARAIGEAVKPLLQSVCDQMKRSSEKLSKIDHISSIDYSLLCQIASNAPKQILLGERSTEKSAYSLEQILAFRSMFTQITEAANLKTKVPFHLAGKVFQPKQLSTKNFDDIDMEEELPIFEIIGQTLEGTVRRVSFKCKLAKTAYPNLKT